MSQGGQFLMSPNTWRCHPGAMIRIQIPSTQALRVFESRTPDVPPKELRIGAGSHEAGCGL